MSTVDDVRTDGRPDDIRLTQWWQSLAASAGLQQADALGAALLASYATPQRRYHGRGHLEFLHDETERRARWIHDPHLIGFAAWFHDAVYEPLAPDNEEQSAAWALRDLLQCGYDKRAAEAVASLILKTKSHHAGDASEDEALFLDMDFAILGAPREVYAQYASAIRGEYAAVPEERFRAGRAAFLKGVLSQPRMFRTELYEAERGAQARANLAWEIETLAAAGR